MRPIQALLFATITAVLAGCASTPSGPPGKHLVYRDGAGNVLRQFDYPSEELCAKVEKIAGGARCQPAPITAGLGAQATLRYSPPGMLVQAAYPDVTRCQAETRQLAAGVELVNACAAR